MQGLFIQYVYLMLIILALVLLADKLRLAYPSSLFGRPAVKFDYCISLVAIAPALVFLICLPPLLYEAASKHVGSGI